MRPPDHDLDDEIRGHLAISIKERIDAGEDPASARRAALLELGGVMRTRESMRDVWSSRGIDAIESLGRDLLHAARSLGRAKGLAATVAITLALGIGANAAIFSVVRQVLLRPLVNRGEDRIVYIRHSAPGLGADNATFSVPEVADITARVPAIASFGEFSTIDFTVLGLGEPRVIKAGVVDGAYFDVMGLRPAAGRLLDERDDGAGARPTAVLTYRFWSTALDRDPAAIGRTITLGTRAVTIVGVLEPSIPYPLETEIIANVVSSPHHLGATMITKRTHRMTELFGRLAPGATIEDARAELAEAHAAMLRAHADSYSAAADMRISVTRLRDQIVAPARTVLLALLAAAALVFAIACSNVANLILARAVRRERELSIRAALGASAGALRRTLLAESLVLCSLGAVLGVLLAPLLVRIVSSYIARFSVRALDVAVDASLLWTGAALALTAAVALAFVPRLPSSAPIGSSGVSTGIRITAGTNRRLRVFAIAQIALTFVLLAGAAMVANAIIHLQRVPTGYDMRQVIAFDVPLPIEAQGTKSIPFVEDAVQRIGRLPGVERVAVGNVVPWRDAGIYGPGFPFTTDAAAAARGNTQPHARLRNVSAGFFAALGIAIVEGREFSEHDDGTSEPVVIVSESVARGLFPAGSAVGRRVWWTDPYFGEPRPRRIVGVAVDVDDERIEPGPAMTIYHPFRQMPFAGRLFVLASDDPYSLVAPVRQIIRGLSPTQPVENAATLADVRTDLLAPDRLNAVVMSGLAGIALLVAVIGVAGVLAFTVSARTREFGVRLAVGSPPARLVARVLAEGAAIAASGIAIGAAGAYAIGRPFAGTIAELQLPDVLAVVAAAAILVLAAAIASLMPAARAARVDLVQALRSE